MQDNQQGQTGYVPRQDSAQTSGQASGQAQNFSAGYGQAPPANQPANPTASQLPQYAPGQQGQQYAGFNPQQPSGETENGFFTKLIIFFQPLYAVLYYLLKREDAPVAAKKALGTGWFAAKFWMIVLLIMIFAWPLISMIFAATMMAAVGDLSSGMGGYNF
jgi:hypothetical protein